MCKCFFYKKYEFDWETGILSLYYAYDTYEFKETILFPKNFQKKEEAVLNQIFFLAHIACGISYYKAFLPEKIEIQSGVLSFKQALFFKNFYHAGLGEFACKNHLTLPDIQFPYGKPQIITYAKPFQNRALVPIGGGKDSCVSVEFLKKLNISMRAFSVGNPKPIMDCVKVSGLEHLILKRTISPTLIALNKENKVYNGHVPITGIIAFFAWISALLYDYKYVVLSAENSANEATRQWQGEDVNHQYSKSFQFEQDFFKITQEITPDFLYFSLLRPLKEIQIAKLFSLLCQKYFAVFNSCNKAFYQEENRRLLWCGNCDKCRFVFLMLAVFMDKESLLKSTHMNPLADESQISGFKALLGLGADKPFECVGTMDESLYAFSFLSKHPDWQEEPVIKAIAPLVPAVPDFDFTTFEKENLVPKEWHFMELLKEFL